MNDQILIFRMKQGDPDACETFIRKYYPEILKYCRLHCRDRTDAEDLTQETFLRFCGALAAYRHSGKAKNYLYTIARNLCIDRNAKQDSLPLDAGQALAQQPEDIDTRLDLKAAIDRLPADRREVIVLHYVQGLKLSETAKVLNIGLPLVKYRLRKAKDELKKLLGEEEQE